MTINYRVNMLRRLMRDRGITAYIIPSSDPHQSEYLSDHFKSREWISGFTGSAGIVVITEKEANLWTDGRYFVQAEKEIEGSEYKLYKMNTPGYLSYVEWIAESIKGGDVLGFDGKVLSQFEVENLLEAFKDRDIDIKSEFDLVGEIWNNRPSLPNSEAFVHEITYTGLSAKEKIEILRNEMKKANIDYNIIASLDDIAWLYNIRGRDIPCNPFIISYAIISKDKAFLFVNKQKISKKVELHLIDNGIEIHDYEMIGEYIKSIEALSKILLDKNKINRWIYNAIPNESKIINDMNITSKIKAVKNPTELENQRRAYIKDGVALTKFLYWLYNSVNEMEVTEFSAQNKLLHFRQEQEGFIESSFRTIAAYKENAAMMHYRPSETDCKSLKKEGMLLIDSGGQYYDGTTDTTRTVILGELSNEERRDFTLTLKSHINLITARFLYGTSGHVLDLLARYPMWQEGLDYKCGTGHGVGYFLGVHEGPQRFHNTIPNIVALEEFMIMTIEPGVYKAGRHGVRTENVVAVQKDIETESGQFMKFEVLSYVPIDLRGLDLEMLTDKEKTWLNDYHKEVYYKIAPFLDEEERQWLKSETRSV